MKPKTPLIPSVCAALALTMLPAYAERSIGFRSSPGSTNFTSAGYPSVLDDEFVFELGAFDSAFTPTASNTALWAANWTPLGRAQYRTAPLNWFNKSATLENNSAPFNIGGQAYIWGHNASGEWILMKSPGWTWPEAVSGIDPGGTTFSVNDTGTTAVLGAVDGVDSGTPFQMMTATAVGDLPDIVPAHWYVQHFSSSELDDPSISGPLADPDGDGAVNLVELAAGTNPEDASSLHLPVLEPYEDSGAIYYRATLERAGRVLMTHALAISSDLETWDISNTDVTVEQDTSTMLILQSVNPVSSFEREFYQFTLYDPNQ